MPRKIIFRGSPTDSPVSPSSTQQASDSPETDALLKDMEEHLAVSQKQQATPIGEKTRLGSLYKALGGGRGLLGQGIRAAADYFAMPGGLPGGAVSGGAEALAELVEGSEFSPAKIGVEAGLGIVPLGRFLKGGHALASGARGAIHGGVGAAARQKAAGGDLDWQGIGLGAAVGGGTGAALGKMMGVAPAAKKTAEEIFEIETTAQKGGQTLDASGKKVVPVSSPRPITSSGAKIEPIGTTEANRGRVPYGAPPVAPSKNALRAEAEAAKLMEEAKKAQEIERIKSEMGLEAQPPTISETVSAKVPGEPIRRATTQYKAPSEGGPTELAEALGVPKKVEAEAPLPTPSAAQEAPRNASSKALQDLQSGKTALRPESGYTDAEWALYEELAAKNAAKQGGSDVTYNPSQRAVERRAIEESRLGGRRSTDPRQPPIDEIIPATPETEPGLLDTRGRSIFGPSAPPADLSGMETQPQSPQFTELQRVFRGGPLKGKTGKSFFTTDREEALGYASLAKRPEDRILHEGYLPKDKYLAGDTTTGGNIPESWADLHRVVTNEGIDDVFTNRRTPLIIQEQVAPGEVPSQLAQFFRTKTGASGKNYRMAQEAVQAGEIPSSGPARAAHMMELEAKKASAQVQAPSPAASVPVPSLQGGAPSEPPTPDWVTKELGIVDALQRLANEQRGAAPIELMNQLGLAAGGAALGAATDPLGDPLLSGLAGGVAGAFAPSIVRNLSKMGVDPNEAAALGIGDHPLTMEGAKAAAKELYHKLPQIQRFNYLMSLEGLPANALVGPYGSAFMGSLEKGLAGDPRGWEAISHLNPATFLSEWKGSIAPARSIIGRAEGGTVNEAVSKFDKMLATPGAYMTAGDLAAKKALERAGFSAEEAAVMTLTNEPESALMRNVAHFGKSKGADGESSAVAQLLFPFKRTAANIFEQGMKRIPGVGFFAPRGMAELNPTLRQQLAEQGLGLATGAAAYGVGSELDPETAKVARRYVTNFGGVHSLPAAIGFAAGMAAHEGKNPITGGAQELPYSLPLPSADPLTDAMKFMGNAGDVVTGDKPLEDLTVPRGAYPAIMREELPKALFGLLTGSGGQVQETAPITPSPTTDGAFSPGTFVLRRR